MKMDVLEIPLILPDVEYIPSTVIDAVSNGLDVFITENVYSDLRGLFEELGLEVEEYSYDNVLAIEHVMILKTAEENRYALILYKSDEYGIYSVSFNLLAELFSYISGVSRRSRKVYRVRSTHFF